MAWVAYDRVCETSTTTGPGNLTLGGAVSGYQAFSTRVANGDRFQYLVYDTTANTWETGIGSYVSATPALARTQVIDSSSGAGTAVSFAANSKLVMIAPLADGRELLYFGSGADGDLTTSSGTTTLSNDTFYKNVTISGTAAIATAGYRLFVSEVLDLTNAPASAIARVPNAGSNASSATGASGGGALTGVTVGGSTAGGGGGAGGTTTGTAGTAGTASTVANGSSGGAGGATQGKGGTGTSGAGGNGGGAGAGSNPTAFARWATDLIRGVSLVVGGCGGGGGGGGGGDGTAGGGGGGGGGGGAVVWIAARAIKRDSSTTTAVAIACRGGLGGSGFAASAGNRGGGGGGSGGGGGYIWVCYMDLIGTAKAAMIDASGGNAGNGANGFGSGTAGAGGDGGDGGRIQLLNLRTGVGALTTGSSGSTNTGTTGGTGGACTATL